MLASSAPSLQMGIRTKCGSIAAQISIKAFALHTLSIAFFGLCTLLIVGYDLESQLSPGHHRLRHTRRCCGQRYHCRALRFGCQFSKASVSPKFVQ